MMRPTVSSVHVGSFYERSQVFGSLLAWFLGKLMPGSEPNPIVPFENQLLSMVTDDTFPYLVFDDVFCVGFDSFTFSDGSL